MRSCILLEILVSEVRSGTSIRLNSTLLEALIITLSIFKNWGALEVHLVMSVVKRRHKHMHHMICTMSYAPHHMVPYDMVLMIDVGVYVGDNFEMLISD